MIVSVKTTFRCALGAGFACTAIAALAAAEYAGVAVPPPLSAQPVTETHWGVKVVDPYRFLENVADPKVVQWTRAQAKATDAILARIAGRAALLGRLREIDAAAGGSVSAIQRTASGRVFFLRREPQESQFKLVWRDGTDGTDTVLVDPESASRAAGGPHAIMDFAPSPDGRLLAYSMQVGGGEIGTLHVVETESGRAVAKALDRIRFASVSWLQDGSGFFYSRLREGYEKLPPTERYADTTRRVFLLPAGEDRPVFSASFNPELHLPGFAAGYVMQVPGTQMAAAIVGLGVERHRLLYVADLADAIAGNAKWRRLVDVKDAVAAVAFAGGWIYLKTSTNAPRFKVIRVPLADPDLAQAQTVIAGGSDVIVALQATRDAVYVTRRRGATLDLLRVREGEGGAPRVEEIALPFAGSVSIVDANAHIDGVVLTLGGWTRTAKPYLLAAGGKGPARLELARSGALDEPQDIEAREVSIRSHDGVEVPLSILVRKGWKRDGMNPTILFGYGAYGVTQDPSFAPRLLAWLERGGVYAIAHVRGGGTFGEQWHHAGRKTTKPNTWKDGIAAAEWLIANGYTSRERIGIYGGSAGGIFVGRAITERPDLFAAAVPSVGVLDTVRSETRANGVANIPEYGTVKKEDEFHALLAMSGYAHVRDGVKYPGVMLVHGVNDTRVDVWQSTKFASRLAAATAGDRPVLLRLDYERGHGSGGTRAQQQAQTADAWSFLLWQFGVPEFQPSALSPK